MILGGYKCLSIELVNHWLIVSSVKKNRNISLSLLVVKS